MRDGYEAVFLLRRMVVSNIKVRWRPTAENPVDPLFEEDWKQSGVSDVDVAFSRVSGIDASDVQLFREVTRRGFLIVVRCPRPTARGWHSKIAPKPMSIKQKTSSSGVVVVKDRMYVSDYDLMSAWRIVGSGFKKIVMSAKGGIERGRWSLPAQELALELNRRLASPIQHGCQDDYASQLNPGVKAIDHFAVFRAGSAEHLDSPKECAEYYSANGLSWPYDDTGKFVCK